MRYAAAIPSDTRPDATTGTRLALHARSDRGRVRPRNQDAFLVVDLGSAATGLVPEVCSHCVGERGTLVAVSDGTGSGDAGEIASGVVLESLREALEVADPTAGGAEQLRHAFRYTASRAWEFARRNRQLAGFGATLTAALVRDGAVYVAHVGDSRAYLVRDDRIRPLTRDQTLAQAFYDSGSMTANGTPTTPHVLLQAFGPRPVVEFEMTAIEIALDDRILVCSDGLTNKIAPVELQRAVRDWGTPAAVCNKLVTTANERGGEDNVTVALLHVLA